MDLSIVIPCYNEVENLKPLVEGLDNFVEEFKRAGKQCEVILVDDGSTDGSFQKAVVLSESRDHMRLIRFRRNFGQTAAMSAGFDHARGRVIVPMDADLQNDPADIPPLLAKLEEGYDVVSGWRKNRKDNWIMRKVPSWVANRMVSWVGGLRLHDYGCTLKAYRGEVLKPVRLYGEMHRFIPIYAMWSGARVTEVPVGHRHRVAGRSKYTLGRTFKVLLDLVTVKFLGGYSTKPLYMFGGLGGVCCLVGVVCGAVALFQKYAYGFWVHRNPLLLLAVFLFIVGLMMVFMGLQAELLVRTYHESQGKPTYLVRETRNLDIAETSEDAAGNMAKGPGGHGRADGRVAEDDAERASSRDTS